MQHIIPRNTNAPNPKIINIIEFILLPVKKSLTYSIAKR